MNTNWEERLDEVWSYAADPTPNRKIRVEKLISALLKEQLEEVEKIVHEVAHEEAKKWEHEQTWKQPYAGNRLLSVGWEIAQRISSLLSDKS